MQYRLIPYPLTFVTPFRLAHGTRTGTQALYLVLQSGGKTGYGEATFPPYLSETAEASTHALENILPRLPVFDDPAQISAFADAQSLSPFTRNLLVNALTDLYLRLNQVSAQEWYPPPQVRAAGRTTFTLTKNDPLDANTAAQVKKFSLLKLKLDGTDDLDFAARIKQLYDHSFCVDANQGWKKFSLEEAANLAQKLKDMGCVLLEQPFEKSQHEKHAALSAMKILPVFADEGIQGPQDFVQHGHCYDGVNIKLLKCGGLDRAYAMAKLVRGAGKQLIVGCMSESSCGCATALVLEPLADYLDLDGPWLINNDPFTGLTIQDERLMVTGEEGLGVDVTLRLATLAQGDRFDV